MDKNTLKNIPARRQIINELYIHGKISKKAKEYGLNILFPHNQWKIWISKILLVIGIALSLAGVIYFFAFNWVKIPAFAKFTILEAGIVSCIIGACFFSLKKSSGKVLLLSASVLIGVFIAVFGMIYQTGADTYQLFLTWSLFIFGWTIVSNFAAQWILWLTITNIFLVLWWNQSTLPLNEMYYAIYIYLALFNGLALALREYKANLRCAWVKHVWTRYVIIIPLVIIITIPITASIDAFKDSTTSMLLSAAVGVIGHGILYYKIKNIFSIAIMLFSWCIIAETAAIKTLEHVHTEALSFLLIGLFTIVVFTSAFIFLCKKSKKMEVNYE